MRSKVFMAAVAIPVLLLALLAITGRGWRHLGKVTAATIGLAQPAASLPLRPTIVGLNLSGVAWYTNDRSFANLILGGHWQFSSPGVRGWPDVDARFIDRKGNLIALPPGGDAVRMLTRPDTGPNGAMIRCTYRGKGDITAHGSAQNVISRPGEVRFRWTNRWDDSTVWLQIHAMDPQAPISQLDCREASLNADVRFAPEYIAALRGYRLLRFMDWQRANDNAPITWRDRHDLTSLDIAGADGTAPEDIVTLSNAVGATPWVTVPWNADDDYIVRFATMLHDGVPAERQVYVEVGNEVWNGMFAVSKQSGREGLARGLSSDYKEAILLRYAQRTMEVMRLWERVFADRPGRLVRVASTFNLLPRTAETVLGFPGLAQHVDALATAPYFGGDILKDAPTTDLDEIFRRLNRALDVSIGQAVANRVVAERFGKRFLAYEAGQHVIIGDDIALAQRVQRDPRMYDLYKRYIAEWRTRVGDTLMLFSSTSPIGRSGAWGLAEHAGQLPSEAPKLRAALEERGR